MTKKKRSARPRTLRRDGERQHEKLVGARRKLVALQPGGSPERPIEVSSAAVVEPRAESFPCPDCASSLRCVEHRAEVLAGQAVRVVDLACRACSSPLRLYFRVVEPLLN